jgi:hypothetical protein
LSAVDVKKRQQLVLNDDIPFDALVLLASDNFAEAEWFYAEYRTARV